MQTPRPARASSRREPPPDGRYATSPVAPRTGSPAPLHTTPPPHPQGDVDKTREVFDSFLARYPLCYAYWRQYANAVAAADGDAEAILERGVAATPYSTDLWIEYVDRVSKREGEDTVDATRTCVPSSALSTQTQRWRGLASACTACCAGC